MLKKSCPLLAAPLTGYEPKALMAAAGRSSSMPVAAAAGNPWWSERALQEHALQAMRPIDLPTEPDGRRTRATRRSRSPVGSHGKREVVQRSRSSEGNRTRGTKRGKGVGGENRGKEYEESLERLLEREMVDMLRDENEML